MKFEIDKMISSGLHTDVAYWYNMLRSWKLRVTNNLLTCIVYRTLNKKEILQNKNEIVIFKFKVLKFLKSKWQTTDMVMALMKSKLFY